MYLFIFLINIFYISLHVVPYVLIENKRIIIIIIKTIITHIRLEV